ncbi:unnamed protein product [Protopolystoma xenopodis]|uniref:Uncharacterized protein n=1 Tax=Protopolystoma xenopodis TaxID=117903 RepID=A0A3S5CK87_9PLAT|nr:unnamed protein product [Protopolystoma xenopodis]
MNFDLGEDVLEVTAVRGLAYPLPIGFSSSDQLDTFVCFELPFPDNDSPQRYSTDWARRSTEPTDYGGKQAIARFTVARKSRSFGRFLQSHKTLKAIVICFYIHTYMQACMHT